MITRGGASFTEIGKQQSATAGYLSFDPLTGRRLLVNLSYSGQDVAWVPHTTFRDLLEVRDFRRVTGSHQVRGNFLVSWRLRSVALKVTLRQRVSFLDAYGATAEGESKLSRQSYRTSITLSSDRWNNVQWSLAPFYSRQRQRFGTLSPNGAGQLGGTLEVRQRLGPWRYRAAATYGRFLDTPFDTHQLVAMLSLHYSPPKNERWEFFIRAHRLNFLDRQRVQEVIFTGNSTSVTAYEPLGATLLTGVNFLL